MPWRSATLSSQACLLWRCSSSSWLLASGVTSRTPTTFLTASLLSSGKLASNVASEESFYLKLGQGGERENGWKLPASWISLPAYLFYHCSKSWGSNIPFLVFPGFTSPNCLWGRCADLAASAEKLGREERESLENVHLYLPFFDHHVPKSPTKKNLPWAQLHYLPSGQNQQLCPRPSLPSGAIRKLTVA